MAWDWGWSAGVHDMFVPEESSHTLGVNGSIDFEHKTSRGVLLTGSFNFLLDHDKDDLDPDHIPVWFRGDYRATLPLARLGDATALNFVADVNGKRNTVSSVEIQIKAFPGIALEHARGPWRIGAKAAVGWYSLEIDDDVPVPRGYRREDLTNDTFAWSAMLDGSVDLGASCTLSGVVQHWGDGDGALEDQVGVKLSWDASRLRADSRIVLHTEYTLYDLSPYSGTAPEDELVEEGLPVLPWDHDLFVRLYFQTKW